MAWKLENSTVFTSQRATFSLEFRCWMWKNQNKLLFLVYNNSSGSNNNANNDNNNSKREAPQYNCFARNSLCVYIFHAPAFVLFVFSLHLQALGTEFTSIRSCLWLRLIFILPYTLSFRFDTLRFVAIVLHFGLVFVHIRCCLLAYVMFWY